MSQNKTFNRYFTYVRPAFKNPLIKTYGAYTLTIFTIAIFIFFAIKPTIETIAVLQKELENAQTTLEKITQKSNNLIVGQKNYEAIPQDVKERISAAVPSQISIKTLIQSLEESANANQASISALQIQPVSVDSIDTSTAVETGQIKFTFNMEGTYPNLTQALDDIQRSSRLISVDSLIFSKAVDATTLLLSVNGKAYFIK